MQKVPLLAHVRSLAGQHGIRIKTETGLRTAEATHDGDHWKVHRVITIHPISGPVPYFTALHEIGHIVLNHQQKTDYELLDSEYEAWAWAIEHAKIKPTASVYAHISRCLLSYLASRNARLPDSHRFWKLAKPSAALSTMAGPRGALP